VYGILRLFTLEYDFIKPGCTVGKIAFVNLFWMELGFLAIYCIAMILCGALHQFLNRENPEEKWIRKPSHPRIQRAALTVMFTMFLQLVKISLQIVHCDKNKLVVELSQTCFEGKHSVAAVVAFCMLFLLVAVPLFVLYRLHFLAKNDKLDQRSVRMKYGFLVTRVKADSYWYLTVQTFLLGFVLMLDSVFVLNTPVRVLITMTAFTIDSFIVLVKVISFCLLSYSTVLYCIVSLLVTLTIYNVYFSFE